MAIKGTEEVIVFRPGEEDRYGDPTAGTTLGILERCLLWPRVSTEVSEEGTVITAGYNIWVPYGPNKDQIAEIVELAATDMVVARGEEWYVSGVPADQRSIRGKRLGVQVITRRIL